MNFSDIRDEVDKIPHLAGELQGEWIFDLIHKTDKNAIICEVGAYYGYMTAIMGYACIGTGRKVFSIDHMIGGQCDFAEGTKCIFLDYVANLKKNGVWDKIVPFPMKSREALKMIELINPKIQLLFLDANHNEEDVYEELCAYDKLIPIGGMICGDDCLPKDTPDSFNKMWESEDLNEFYFQGVSQSVWKFFKGNERFEILPNVPGNQFGFRKIL